MFETKFFRITQVSWFFYVSTICGGVVSLNALAIGLLSVGAAESNLVDFDLGRRHLFSGDVLNTI